MKKVLSAVLAAAMLVSMTACGSSASSSTAPAASGSTAPAESSTAPAEKQDITIQFIPKVRQEAFWNAVEAGATKAAEDLGVTLTIQGDPAGSNTAAKQAQYVESATELKVDAIAFAALDENTTDAALQAAMKAGIKVVGFDSDPGAEARDWFVNQADPEGIARACLDDMSKQLAAKGFTADNKALVFIVSTNPTTPNQNTWIENIKKLYFSDYEIPRTADGAIDFDTAKANTKANKYTVNEQYANMDLRVDPDADIIYGADDHTTSKTQISNKLAANPNTNGLIVLTTNAIAATNDSIVEKNKQDSCIFNGIAVPSDSKAYLESGVMSTVVLWQAYDLGYLAVETAVQAVKDEISGDMLVSHLSGTAQVEGASTYPAEGHKIIGKEIILGDPAVFTLETADQFKK